MRRVFPGSVLLTAVLAIALTTGGGAAYASSQSSDTVASPVSEGANPVDVIEEEALQYVELDDDGTYFFDEEAARVDGASEEALLAGSAFERAAEASEKLERADSSSTQAAAKISIPVWGNWCGPGHGGGKPVDTLDTLCKRHDLCYGQRGYFNCACDAQLKAEIDRYASRMKPKERAMAAAVKMAFSVGICNPF